MMMMMMMIISMVPYPHVHGASQLNIQDRKILSITNFTNNKT